MISIFQVFLPDNQIFSSISQQKVTSCFKIILLIIELQKFLSKMLLINVYVFSSTINRAIYLTKLTTTDFLMTLNLPMTWPLFHCFCTFFRLDVRFSQFLANFWIETILNNKIRLYENATAMKQISELILQYLSI